MNSLPSPNLFPFGISKEADRYSVPVKPTVILIRWPVVIICSYLLLYPSVAWVSPALLHSFILLYILSNVTLYFVHEQRFHSVTFYSSAVIVDTLILTLSLIINGNAGTDFYLAYFLLIIISCIFEDPKLLAVISVSAPLIYALLLLQLNELNHPSVYLRLPFLFVVSLFYGFFAQLIRVERGLKQQAEQEMQVKMELLGLISHELRTPLTLINGFAQALKSGALGAINEEQNRSLGEMIKQSDNLLSGISAIMEVSRIDAGELTVEREQFILANFIEELKVNCGGPFEKPLTLIWDFASESQMVRSDRRKLSIILQNLLNNAIKFTAEGEIRISGRYRPQLKRLEFEVSDTGIGIPKEAFPFIFDKFHQVDSSYTRSYPGMGLGLYVVKAFAELLGGTVTCQSEPGKGSTFRVAVPA